jgi:hypothetical protein
LGVVESVGIETVASPPETIAGDRSPAVFAVAFVGVAAARGAGAADPAGLAGPIVTFPPPMIAGESLPRVEAV